jgi:hypothetical protein
VTRNRRVVAPLRRAVAGARAIWRAAPLVLVMIVFALAGCTEPTAPQSTMTGTAATATTAAPSGPALATMMDEPSTPPGAQPRLASDPAQLADDLVADEQALRNGSTAEAALVAAARRQQAAYRAIGQHPEWDAITRPRIPPALLDVYDRNVDARRLLRPTNCWATTTRRSRNPASAGTT